ncbi:MAG TPA: YdaS family helix-turn-helix protein [Thauera aminoaromatica]|nr:YdaS family helix-turn-helix protein [Thauera aminoaromatica]
MNLQTYLETHKVSQSEFARRLGITPGLVWQWLNGVRPISATKVIPIETATAGAVCRHELRPDIYPPSEVA